MRTEIEILAEIESGKITITDALEEISRTGAYLLIQKIANMELTKSERLLLITLIPQVDDVLSLKKFFLTLKSYDEIKLFLEGCNKSNNISTSIYYALMIWNDIDKKIYFRPIIDVLAGKTQEFLGLIKALIKKIDNILLSDIEYLYEHTSSKDFANIVNEHISLFSEDILKFIFEMVKELENINPPASRLILHALDIQIIDNPGKYSFEDDFKMYMYEFTGNDEYLPDDIKSIFIY